VRTGRPFCSRPRPTSNPCRSTRRLPGPSVASLRAPRAGGKPQARAYDALIAAVAIANRLPVHTCNPSDFAGIDDLRVVAVPPPEA
jgi:predicted nucleic acid-binding protein